MKLDTEFPKQYSMLALSEAFYLTQIFLALDRTGVLETLQKGATAGRLAEKHRLNSKILHAALLMLAQRTSFVKFQRGKFSLTARYDANAIAAFHQYLGAYRNNAVELTAILRDPSVAETLIDRKEHARAFERTQTLSATMLADLVVQLGLNHVLDLGCGSGRMLLELAARDFKFIAWGVDLNPWMCTVARRQIKAAKADKQVRVFTGDCRDLETSLPKTVIAKVQTITAASLINEFCADGGAAAIAWLSRLRATFPGRTLLVCDYYGRLGTGRRTRPDIALHDFTQLISGQGIPPSSLTAWKKIYRAAGCRIVHAIEGNESSFFAHVIKL